jgi:hypothetical protein
MSNTIKLKRGSGSDPSASDLSIGEIAIRTDSGKLFTKKDNGTVAEISGSGGIDDGDKGDITVSNGGDTFTIDSGVIDNANIASNAAIDVSKLSGVLPIAGGTLTGNLVINNSSPSLTLTDSGDNPDFEVKNQDGTFIIKDTTNNANRLFITSSAVDINVNLDANAGLDVTGDITGTGNLTLTSTDTGSSAAPEFELYRNSASPADADYLGQLKFTGESDDGSKEVYAKVTGKIDDASSGTEDGLIEFALRKAGSNNIAARFTSTDLKLINGTGLEVAGDTETTGDIKVNSISKSVQVGDISGDNYLQLIQVSNNSTKRGFTTQHSSASIFENLQGSTTQHLILGDSSNDNRSVCTNNNSTSEVFVNVCVASSGSASDVDEVHLSTHGDLA